MHREAKVFCLVSLSCHCMSMQQLYKSQSSPLSQTTKLELHDCMNVFLIRGEERTKARREEEVKRYERRGKDRVGEERRGGYIRGKV